VLLSHGALAAHVRHWEHWVGEMLANRAHPPPARAHPLRTAASAHPCARFAHPLCRACAPRPHTPVRMDRGRMLLARISRLLTVCKNSSVRPRWGG